MISFKSRVLLTLALFFSRPVRSVEGHFSREVTSSKIDSLSAGSGGWAENGVAAISTTGHGESILRVCLAHRVASSVQQGASAQEASDEAVEHMKERVRGAGGLVTVDAAGRVGVSFSSERMTWAYAKDGDLHSGILPGEDCQEAL